MIARQQLGHGRRIIGAAAVAVALIALPAAAAPVANGVLLTSVAPDPAARSARVVVQGHGFGAGNAVVRLGGEPVLPDVALGSRVEFVVPAYALPGEQALEVENPGGIVARGSLTVLFDGRVRPVVDRTRTVMATIGPAGGSLVLGDVTLTIPPGALLAPIDISMAPLTTLAGSPLVPLHDAVHLEPSGLTLLKPATLAMPLRTSAADLATFLYEEDGVDMHLVPWRIDGSTVKILVSHFSGGGAAGGAGAPTMFSFSPSNAQARAEQQIAVALTLLAQGSIDQAQFDATVDAALLAWSQSVFIGFMAAQAGSLYDFEFAVADWQAWEAVVIAYGREQALAAVTGARRTTARLVAIVHARRILATCTGADPDPFAPVREMVRLAGVLAIDDAVFDLAAVAPDLANGPDLVFQCMRIDIDRFDGPPVFARGSPPRNTLQLRAQVVFASGPPRRDIPMVFEVDEMRNSVGGPTNLVNEAVSAGTLSRQVEIAGLDGGSRGHLAAYARLAAQAGDPSLALFDTSRQLSRDVRTRTELTHLAGGSYVTDLASLRSGGTASFRVRLAGDGMDRQPALAFSENPQLGTLTPALANATATGEASFTYDVSVGTTAQQACVRVDWSYAGTAEGDSDCFAITASGTPPPPPPPPPDFDPTYAVYNGTIQNCSTPGGCTSLDVTVQFLPSIVPGSTHFIKLRSYDLCMTGASYSYAKLGTGGALEVRPWQCGYPAPAPVGTIMYGTVSEHALTLLVYDGPCGVDNHCRIVLEASR